MALERLEESKEAILTKEELKVELEAAVAFIKSTEGVIGKIWLECSAFDLSEEQKVWNDSLADASQKLLDAWKAFETFQRGALESSEDARDYRDRILYPGFDVIKAKREQ